MRRGLPACGALILKFALLSAELSAPKIGGSGLPRRSPESQSTLLLKDATAYMFRVIENAHIARNCGSMSEKVAPFRYMT